MMEYERVSICVLLQGGYYRQFMVFYDGYKISVIFGGCFVYCFVFKVSFFSQLVFGSIWLVGDG